MSLGMVIIQVGQGAGDVAQWLESRNSNPKTMGSIPWLVRVSDRLFCPSESTLEWLLSMQYWQFMCSFLTEVFEIRRHHYVQLSKKSLY